ncbi:MAG TPA: CPBP family glutamic-type intramembrane protease [Patescibacteria group bacterium]|nr:CPBP family glutamic-type intramembrane protease [Patescibacteria group bacterium]
MKNQTYAKYISLFFICLSGVLLIGLQQHIAGWIAIVCGTALTWILNKRTAARELFLPFISISIMGVTPISTNISPEHIVAMGGALGLALILPFLISRFFYKEDKIKYNFHIPHKWKPIRYGYILFAFVLAYLMIPFYLKTSGVYHNWPVMPGFMNLFVLFLGTNLLGIWDELFFVSTTLGILKRYFPFMTANIATTIVFTSFLYELGFREWGFLIVPIFCFLQGWVYNKTNDLVYVIAIHLTVDFILYFALLHANYPSWIPVFITG